MSNVKTTTDQDFDVMIGEARLEVLDLRRLEIDHDYQRKLGTPKWSKSEFDHNSMGVIVVNERPCGSLVVMDGQHRRHRCLTDGHYMKLCLIYNFKNIDQERDYFKKLNTGKPVSPIDKFKVDLGLKVPAALDIANTLKKYDLSIGRGVDQIEGISYIYRCHKNGNLDETIQAVLAFDKKNGWDNARLLQATSMFLKRTKTRDNRPVKLERLIEVFSRTEPNSVIQSRTSVAMMVTTIIGLYEHKLRGKDRITPTDAELAKE